MKKQQSYNREYYYRRTKYMRRLKNFGGNDFLGELSIISKTPRQKIEKTAAVMLKILMTNKA